MMAVFMRKFIFKGRLKLTAFVLIIFWCLSLYYLLTSRDLKATQDSKAEILRFLFGESPNLSPATFDDESPQVHSNNCILTEEEQELYPDCSARIKVLMKEWLYDLHNTSHFPESSLCYIVSYVIHVEKRCPKAILKAMNVKYQSNTNTNTSLDDLLGLLKDPGDKGNYGFIRSRITSLWDTWMSSIVSLRQKQKMDKRRRRRILIHLGLLDFEHFLRGQYIGGPLGELVQWSDLIACLYILGHNMVVTSEVNQIKTLLLGYQSFSYEMNEDLPFELLYTDIAGWQQIQSVASAEFQRKVRCILRIVDSFGTEPAYNNPIYAKQHRILKPAGGLGLHPQQFATLFPHSPDNSFLGFVVQQFHTTNHTKKNQAVVYGKALQFFNGKTKYLDLVKKYVDIHTTVYNAEKGHLPKYLHHHGVLKWTDLQVLLRQSKIFLGLGIPYEGPAPLEAIAQGCVFINPKIKPPKSYRSKPTNRTIYSQHQYAADMIGEPHVYTINMDDYKQVEKTLSHILKSNKFEPYLPYEFTQEGMLQRMNAYVEHQNFCVLKRVTKWPPKASIKFGLSEAGKSCKDFCWTVGHICEPSYFPEANYKDTLKQIQATYQFVNISSDIYYPACNIKTKNCIQQRDKTLFSCVGEHPYLRRICPCRDFQKGQTAICADCS